MNGYIVEFDTIMDGCFEMWFSSDEFEDILEWAEEKLEECGGGHADIFTEEGDFVEDVEV